MQSPQISVRQVHDPSVAQVPSVPALTSPQKQPGVLAGKPSHLPSVTLAHTGVRIGMAPSVTAGTTERAAGGGGGVVGVVDESLANWQQTPSLPLSPVRVMSRSMSS